MNCETITSAKVSCEPPMGFGVVINETGKVLSEVLDKLGTCLEALTGETLPVYELEENTDSSSFGMIAHAKSNFVLATEATAKVNVLLLMLTGERCCSQDDSL